MGSYGRAHAERGILDGVVRSRDRLYGGDQSWRLEWNL